MSIGSTQFALHMNDTVHFDKEYRSLEDLKIDAETKRREKEIKDWVKASQSKYVLFGNNMLLN